MPWSHTWGSWLLPTPASQISSSVLYFFPVSSLYPNPVVATDSSIVHGPLVLLCGFPLPTGLRPTHCPSSMWVCVRAKSLQSCPALPPRGLQPARLLCPWDSPGKNTGVGCQALLQGIFPTQGSKLRLLHWQVGSLAPSHLGSPWAPCAKHWVN